MTLVEELLQADTKKADELATEKYSSRQLAKIVGKKTVEITLQEVAPQRMNDIIAMQFDRKGNYDAQGAFDAKALCCVEGVVDPPLKEKELIHHFVGKGGTPKDLAIKLFRGEMATIADKITDLSGYGKDEEVEEEIKN